LPATIRARPGTGTSEPFGFERLPLSGLAATIFAFLAAPALGSFATLVQLACLAAILGSRWRSLPGVLPRSAALLLLPLFAAASVLWSAVPDISLRYGLQLLATVVMGIAVGRLLTLRQLVLAVFVGTSLACLAGLATGRAGMSEHGPVLIGLAGSKNQMGYIALIWLGAALCVLGSRAYGIMTRVAATLALVPAGFLIMQGDSATALVTGAVLVGLLGLMAVAAWMGRGGRLFALVGAGLLTLPALVALPELERQAEILRTDVLEKDARLTGRTLLWEEADRLIAQAPVIGHGYKAIWLGPTGKGLLARNGQSDGRTFHFHDTFRELMADLGAVGLALFLLPIAFALVRGVVLLVAHVDAPRAFAIATMLTILLRVRTELVVGPFMIDTVLLVAIAAALSALPLTAQDNYSKTAPRRRAAAPRQRIGTRALDPRTQRNPA
jgi:exopolysaccharide production protein ExoQ